jgi:hypothetical protein
VASEQLSRRALFGKASRLGLALAAGLSSAYVVGQAIAQARSHHSRADWWPHAPRADMIGPHSPQADAIGPHSPQADYIGPHSPQAFVDSSF